MVALLHELYPENEDIRYCLASVLSSTGHFLGMKRIKPDFENISFLENLFMRCHMEYLKVPTDRENIFFPSQKHIYDGISSPYFSFSAPTSMGKTFMMRVFIKEKILADEEKKFSLFFLKKEKKESKYIFVVYYIKIICYWIDIENFSKNFNLT